jgi:hypothetical protein
VIGRTYGIQRPQNPVQPLSLPVVENGALSAGGRIGKQCHPLHQAHWLCRRGGGEGMEGAVVQEISAGIQSNLAQHYWPGAARRHDSLLRVRSIFACSLVESQTHRLLAWCQWQPAKLGSRHMTAPPSLCQLPATVKLSKAWKACGGYLWVVGYWHVL